jgi:TfoX/Sxy family transcriptional regulator of competence genes
MAWVKVPPEHHPLFLAALPEDPRVETLKMFGGVAARVNGHVFAGLFGRSTMLLLPDGDREEALRLPGAAMFDPMGDGRLRSEKVMLPEALMRDAASLRGWVGRAFAAAVKLPAKASGAKGARAPKASPAPSAGKVVKSPATSGAKAVQAPGARTMPSAAKAAVKSPAKAGAKAARPPAASTAPSDAEAAFSKLVAALTRGDSAVEPPKASRREFGSNGLKVNGKLFAMLVRGALVLKLPKTRVQALLDAGAGAAFDAGKGKPMKEWVVVKAPSSRWAALAREAREFVGT